MLADLRDNVPGMKCATIITGTGGRVERGLPHPTHRPSPRSNWPGLMIGTGGQERGYPVPLLPGTIFPRPRGVRRGPGAPTSTMLR